MLTPRIIVLDCSYQCNLNKKLVWFVWCVWRVSRKIRLNIDGVDIGDIRNSSKLKNIDKTYIRLRLWVWGNDSHTSLTCIRDRLWVSRRYLHTSLRCIEVRQWVPRNYLQGSLRFTRARLWVPGKDSHLLYLYTSYISYISISPISLYLYISISPISLYLLYLYISYISISPISLYLLYLYISYISISPISLYLLYLYISYISISPISLYLLYLHRWYLIGFPRILSECIESLSSCLKITLLHVYFSNVITISRKPLRKSQIDRCQFQFI